MTHTYRGGAIVAVLLRRNLQVAAVRLHECLLHSFERILRKVGVIQQNCVQVVTHKTGRIRTAVTCVTAVGSRATEWAGADGNTACRSSPGRCIPPTATSLPAPTRPLPALHALNGIGTLPPPITPHHANAYRQKRQSTPPGTRPRPQTCTRRSPLVLAAFLASSPSQHPPCYHPCKQHTRTSQYITDSVKSMGSGGFYFLSITTRPRQ